MTKKHFQMLADALKEARREALGSGTNDEEYKSTLYGIKLVESEIIRVCKSVNPRFDSGRFLESAKY
jgi:hypothetical protein